MDASVQVQSNDAGVVRTITVTQTAQSAVRVEMETSSAPGSVQSYNFKNVSADQPSLTIACQLDALFSADVRMAVTTGGTTGHPSATINVSHAILGNGVYIYPLRAGDDARVRDFLERAAFPPLAQSDA
jgi:hypothetical protein